MDGLESWSNYMASAKTAIAVAVGVDAAFIMDARNLLVEEEKAAGVPGKPADMFDSRKYAADVAALHIKSGETITKTTRLFNLVKSYADMAGRKFMVALPLLCAAEDNSTPYAIRTNWVHSDGAWTESNIQLHALAPELAPDSPLVELFRNSQDGRIEAFVFFHTGGAVAIDYTQCTPDNVVPLTNFSCFVRATVEEITFLNPLALTYPRAIVSIDAPIVLKPAFASEVDAPIIDALRATFMEDEDFRKKMVDRPGDDAVAATWCCRPA